MHSNPKESVRTHHKEDVGEVPHQRDAELANNHFVVQHVEQVEDAVEAALHIQQQFNGEVGMRISCACYVHAFTTQNTQTWVAQQETHTHTAHKTNTQRQACPPGLIGRTPIHNNALKNAPLSASAAGRSTGSGCLRA